MKKLLLLLMVLFLCAGAEAQEFSSLNLINSVNWGKYFNDLLGYRYESRGNIHFYPADMQLLYETMPSSAALVIKPYKLKEGDPAFSIDKLPYLVSLAKVSDEVQKLARLFKSAKTEMQVFPSFNVLVIMVDNAPYARLDVSCGTNYDHLAPLSIEEGKPIEWDNTLARPTQQGAYKLFGITARYPGVPFGTWLEKVNGAWCYLENDWWYKLPGDIAQDIEKSPGKRSYKYFDESADPPAARFAGGEFGRYVMLWSADGVYRAYQMGYAPGELLYEQAILVKDLVQLLTEDGADDLDELAKKNPDLTLSKQLAAFINSQGSEAVTGVDGRKLDLFRLFKGWNVQAEIDPRLMKAFREVRENRLPRGAEARQKALGLYRYIEQNCRVLEKQASWYEKTRKNFGFIQELRAGLRGDFSQMGVLSKENRQNVLEEWLNQRLEFKPAVPPSEAKYVKPLSFAGFFKPDEKLSVFAQREGAVMRRNIQKILSGEVTATTLESVDALNAYNFGVLLNDILGDLYKSHGCLHVSPRNSLFLYELLPVGTKMKIYPYSKTISAEALAAIPLLANLVNFKEDLERIKGELADPAKLQIEVYPFAGLWIINLSSQPFAQLSVKGGPQKPYYLMDGRDERNRPIFEPNLAYPSTPGNYYIFKKVTDYYSNLYKDLTIIPMGGVIRRKGDAWMFYDKAGNAKSLPTGVAQDLGRPPEAREYSYYDAVKNSSDEVVEVKWGSHPFGKYAIQTSVDRRTMFPELIHSSGDLIMEERQIVSDLISLLSEPYDDLAECVDYNPNFYFYKTCYDFVKDPASGEALGLREKAAYKQHYGLPLTTEEAASISQDVVIAYKLMKGGSPTAAEKKFLAQQGLTDRQGKINLQKIYGLQLDNYMYVVTIQKYAHHYAVLAKHWAELSGLRLAMLQDFNNFVIKDQSLFHRFMRELMLGRIRLEKITPDQAFRTLDRLLEQPAPAAGGDS